jgi:hypothetical protein
MGPSALLSEEVKGSCEHSNMPSGSIKGKEFLDNWANENFPSIVCFTYDYVIREVMSRCKICGSHNGS